MLERPIHPMLSCGALLLAMYLFSRVSLSDDTKTAAPPVKTAAPSDMCASLKYGVDVRIEEIKTWQAEAKKAQTSPSNILSRALQDLPGAQNDDAGKIAQTRHTIDDLNRMLRASNCPPVDVDYELTQPPRK